MRTLAIVMACVVASTQLTQLAVADGTPSGTRGVGGGISQVIAVEVALDSFDRSGLSDDLPWHDIEPGGLEVRASANPAWFQLGLKPGDVIELINASPPWTSPGLGEGLTIYDVRRGDKHVQLRIMARGPVFRTTHLADGDMVEIMDTHKAADAKWGTTIKRAGVASGLRITDPSLAFRIGLQAGDIVRTLAGLAITTDRELFEAVRDLPPGHTDMVLERDGRPITVTLEREPPSKP